MEIELLFLAIKLIYYEKAKLVFEKKPLPLVLTFNWYHQNKWEIFSKFCGLFRKSELCKKHHNHKNPTERN